MSQLSCFFKQYASMGVNTPVLTRRAVYISSALIQCPLPSAQEFPLPCTCECSGSNQLQNCLRNLQLKYTQSGPIQTNVTTYNFDGSATVSSSPMSVKICSCCPGTGPGNCSVTLGIGVNLQLATYGQDSLFLYMLDSPEVLGSCIILCIIGFGSIFS